jgi:hypothetical protein
MLIKILSKFIKTNKINKYTIQENSIIRFYKINLIKSTSRIIKSIKINSL